MMKIFITFVIFFSLNTYAKITSEFSGNIEAQVRQVNNNKEAKEAPLYQDWNNENFYLLYGNLSGKVELNESRIEANWFARYSQSDLYRSRPLYGQDQGPYLATKIYTFPNDLVARDVFKLQHVDQTDSEKTESVLNKFFYEWDFEDQRFMFGRIYINYGTGEIFNPINPFNQPTALTSTSQVAQGNDGFSYTLFIDEKHTLQFLLLGDKKLNDYDGTISKTVWAHGEYQYNNDLQFNYVIGEDQERHKLGGEINYQTEAGLIFSQVFYQTENLKNRPSENLLDILIGYDQQLTNKWHLRFEGGYQDKNDYADLNGFERFLPTEYFGALANVYEFHPLFKGSGTIINDVKSGFTYLIIKGTYGLNRSTELEIFGFTPVAKGDQADNLAQKLVTTDVGISLRAFF